ncbi:MAG TPA: hypothetical protein VFE78_19535 [Gemmataceae bacterium]|jgi:hypothetical protein|nr:hypothetical protein [Gemmataceae bacterium]
MTEAEWLAGTDPQTMLRHLGRKGGSRKLRLFAVACGRRAWEQIQDETCRRAVEVAERYADRQAHTQARDQMTRAVRALCGPRARACYSLAYHVVRGTRYTFVNAQIAAAHANWTVTGVRVVGEAPAAEAAESTAQCGLLRDIYGNPFRSVAAAATWLVWDGGTVRKLAQAIYDDRAFDRLPVLADALEEAGCANEEILNHCRRPSEHTRGCWAVDLLLGESRECRATGEAPYPPGKGKWDEGR